MKFNKIVLLTMLMLGSCLMMVPADAQPPEKAERVKEAQSKLAELKKAIKCAWSGKGCTGTERAKIIAKGAGLLAVVAAISGVGYWRWWRGLRLKSQPSQQGTSRRRRGRREEEVMTEPQQQVVPSYTSRASLQNQDKDLRDLAGQARELISKFNKGDQNRTYLSNALGEAEIAIKTLDEAENEENFQKFHDKITALSAAINGARQHLAQSQQQYQGQTGWDEEKEKEDSDKYKKLAQWQYRS